MLNKRRRWFHSSREKLSLVRMSASWFLVMLNKRRRWFHPSLEKLPLVRMSASWLLASTYLIWILGCKLILSDNQSSTTLWVLDTCLVVGLLPLMITLITASLSSKMYNWDSHWEECVLVDTKSTTNNCSNSLFRASVDVSVLFFVNGMISCLAQVLQCCLWTKHLNHNIPKVESRQSVHAQSSIQRYDFRCCRTVGYRRSFTSYWWGPNVRLPNTHETPPEVDFESSQSLAESESWNKPTRQCWAVLLTWQHCWNSFAWWMYDINLAKCLCIVAKRDNMLSLSPLANQVKSFPEICSTFQIAFCGKKRMAVKVATGECGVVHDIKEMQQVVPLNTRETALC